ncbi:GyrI-like domain-containing protein [Agrococcus sp. TF02-05]|uniref:GyrI-like domain-containing protein n=1 Tax=Agrococcus sp. TF02-05 TaxID=2815211 RepID=UPI001AA1C89C|nr:GyrI-like domain-containing protein [Agrococcus sp. TF02-05]MBO1769595.1 GyrI-like domain-containing protein [Agrococcus sp. TF02-05]
MTAKIDLKRELDAYRAKQGEVRFVDVPPLSYLAIDGHGDPNGPAFAEAVAALYPLAYALKMASKRELGRDFTVMPLEGLWSADDWSSFTDARDKTRWDWTLLILQPDWIDEAMLEAARERVAAKGAPEGSSAARLADVRLERLEEGRCVQTLHVGAFDDEGPVLARIHDEILPAHGLRPRGRHHEIYLSDARRVEPAKRRTILRQPVEPA